MFVFALSKETAAYSEAPCCNFAASFLALSTWLFSCCVTGGFCSGFGASAADGGKLSMNFFKGFFDRKRGSAAMGSQLEAEEDVCQDQKANKKKPALRFRAPVPSPFAWGGVAFATEIESSS
jgi:hypothetical protein